MSTCTTQPKGKEDQRTLADGLFVEREFINGVPNEDPWGWILSFDLRKVFPFTFFLERRLERDGS